MNKKTHIHFKINGIMRGAQGWSLFSQLKKRGRIPLEWMKQKQYYFLRIWFFISLTKVTWTAWCELMWFLPSVKLITMLNELNGEYTKFCAASFNAVYWVFAIRKFIHQSSQNLRILTLKLPFFLQLRTSRWWTNDGFWQKRRNMKFELRENLRRCTMIFSKNWIEFRECRPLFYFFAIEYDIL